VWILNSLEIIVAYDFNRALYKYGTLGVAEAAIQESIISQLPGRENGPADAYRHILLAAELTRRFGETIAREFLDQHELSGNADGQTPEAEVMDRANNEIGVQIGRTAQSWSEVVSSARTEFGATGQANWLPANQWNVNPKDENGIRIPTGDPRLNWPPTWPSNDLPFPGNDYAPGDGNIGDADFGGDPFTGLPWPGAVSSTLGTDPDPLVKFIKYVPRTDPLVLDLDGDGFEITAVNRTPPVLFDTDANTVKTATAWVSSDDGLLVLDRNGNGTIDSGRELFGDETVLANGSKASNGFTALASLDSNADGQFNALDTQFTAVRVWRDLNQDGISQAGELKTLVETGITRIGLTATDVSQKYGDAQLQQTGTFTRADDGIGQAGSFLFATNSFMREFTPITVSSAAAALPNIGGSGWARDLQDAATLSPELIDMVNAAKNATTRSGYRAAVDSLLREWGNDSAYQSVTKTALANGYGLILSEPLNAQERGWMDVAIKGTEAARATFRSGLSATDRANFDAMRERMVGDLEPVLSR
jgi:hypothetical protein